MSRPPRARRLAYVLVTSLVVASAAAVRVAASLDDFWLDEIWSWTFATRVHSAYQILTDLRHDNNHFLNTWIIYLIGTERHWIFYRLPAVMAGIMTVGLCGLFAKRWGHVEALTALIMTGSSFFLIQYSSEARGYAYVMLFSIASLELAARSFEKGAGGSICCSAWPPSSDFCRT